LTDSGSFTYKVITWSVVTNQRTSHQLQLHTLIHWKTTIIIFIDVNPGSAGKWLKQYDILAADRINENKAPTEASALPSYPPLFTCNKKRKKSRKLRSWMKKRNTHFWTQTGRKLVK